MSKTRRMHEPKGVAMKTQIIDISLVIILVVPLMAREKIDTLIMTNGDRMTCEIKGLNAGILYVSFDYIDGTASVDWSKVAHLESSQLFVVKTEDGSVYTGTLKTPAGGAERPVKIEVSASPGGQTEIDRSRIVEMIGTSDNFWERFNGAVNLGVIYSKGNQSTQYSLGSEAAYVRERWSAQASFDSNLSSSAGASTSTRNSLNARALRLMPKKNWFYSGVGDFLQSSEQGITLQTTVGGGVGRYLKNTNRSSLAVLAGGAWQNTEYQKSLVPIGKQNLATALIYGELQLFRFSKTNLDATAALLPAISDPGRVRFNANATYYIKLFSDLKWNVSFYGNWDNRPPPGFSGSDYGTSSGLSWTFGLK
jgi:hypothetical protein